MYRRGGRFVQHESANVTYLASLVREYEQRYRSTSRDATGNRLVRQWLTGHSGDVHMFDQAGRLGSWYAKLQVGKPAQELEFDLDMLTPDLYTIMTTNNKGSRYDTFLSETHESLDGSPFQECRGATDVFTLPHHAFADVSAKLKLPICQPLKSTQHTLSNSGSVLGIGPPRPRSLSRVGESIVEQLFEQKKIDHEVMSLTLLTSEHGVLSVGGSLAPQVERHKIEIETRLEHVGNTTVISSEIEQIIDNAFNFAIPPGSTYKDHFRWTDAGARASSGWYATLMEGVWISGVKVLKNQPVVFDINCPFLLAPPEAVTHMYEAIGGTIRLADVDIDGGNTLTDGFHAFPCLNEVDISLEFAGWKFPIAQDSLHEDALHGPVGGIFSLGKVGPESNSTERASSGYCVGVAVESTLSTNLENTQSGMSHVWILGEPFFRGLGIVFEPGDDKGKGQKIGFRTY